MDKINQLTLPATILIASIILGGFYYFSEVSKEKSIERQQQIEIQAKTEADKVKAEQNKTQQQIDLQAKANQEYIKLQANKVRQANLSACLKTVEDNYQANFNDYCILEGKEPNCKSIKIYHNEDVLATEKNEKEDCYKQYK